MTPRYSKTATTLVLLILVVGAGAWFRLWALDRLPPLALHIDEGAYGLDALDIMRGNWMVFAPQNSGRETLFMTLAAGVFRVFGVNVLAFRLLAAIIGVLTLPAIYWLGWEAAPDREQPQWLGLLAAAGVAFLLMHVVINRNALRVNMLPLVTALAFAALLRAFRLRRAAWFILAGALLGLSVYTYPSARLLPIPILVAFALWWPRDREQWRLHLLRLAAVVGMAMLVFAPLGLYFLRHPDLFLYRAQDLYDPTALGRSIGGALRIFHVQGEPILNFNLPYRPVLDAAQAVAFWIGAAAALVGHYKQAGRLILAWFVIGVLPAALTTDGSIFSHAFGMIAPLAVLMGCGYLSAGTWLAAQLRRLPSLRALARPIAAGLVLAGLGYSAWRTHQDYFVHWASRPDLPLAYRADLMRIDQYMRSLPPDTEVFFSPYAKIEAPLEFTRAGETARLHPFDGHHCVPLGDAVQRPLAYFVSDPFSLDVLRQYFPTGQESAATEFKVFQIGPNAIIHLPAGSSGQAVWAEQLALPHAEVRLADAQTVTASLVWQTRPASAAVDYHRFIHLLTDDPAQPGGVRLWAQSDDALCHGTHPVAYWQTGEMIVDTATLAVAAPLPPGDYRLVVGLYQLGAPVRLAVTETSWVVKDDAVTVATLTIR